MRLAPGSSRGKAETIMSEKARPPLKTITLHAARSKIFPGGSSRHGYEFLAPLTPSGHIDVEAWKARRGECFVHRFWGDAPPLRGLLVHRPGGHGGSTWAFEYGEGTDLADDEDGFRFGDHVFKVGEYVSVREEGELTPFRVASAV
jgi:hypothetical protein